MQVMFITCPFVSFFRTLLSLSNSYAVWLGTECLYTSDYHTVRYGTAAYVQYRTIPY